MQRTGKVIRSMSLQQLIGISFTACVLLLAVASSLVISMQSGETVQRLNKLIGQVLAMPDVQQRLSTVGAEVAGGTPEQFAALIKRETAGWANVIERSGIKLE